MMDFVALCTLGLASQQVPFLYPLPPLPQAQCTPQVEVLPPAVGVETVLVLVLVLVLMAVLVAVKAPAASPPLRACQHPLHRPPLQPAQGPLTLEAASRRVLPL